MTVENGVLTISGERTFEKEENGKKYRRIERAYGSFVRAFTLPEDARAEKIRAEFKDGMLTVHLPKSEKARPKQIEVQVAHNGAQNSRQQQSQPQQGQQQQAQQHQQQQAQQQGQGARS